MKGLEDGGLVVLVVALGSESLPLVADEVGHLGACERRGVCTGTRLCRADCGGKLETGEEELFLQLQRLMVLFWGEKQVRKRKVRFE